MVNKYYQKQRESLQKETRKRCFSAEEKDKRRKKTREGYQNFSEK